MCLLWLLIQYCLIQYTLYCLIQPLNLIFFPYFWIFPSTTNQFSTSLSNEITRKFTSPVETLIVDPKATEDTGNTDKVFAIDKVFIWKQFYVSMRLPLIFVINPSQQRCKNAAEKVPFITFATLKIKDYNNPS